MVNTMEVREDDEEFQNQVDLMFADLEKENPEHFAVRHRSNPNPNRFCC